MFRIVCARSWGYEKSDWWFLIRLVIPPLWPQLGHSFFLFLPGFWSGLKSSRLGMRLALKLVSTCFGSYVPGAVVWKVIFDFFSQIHHCLDFILNIFTWGLVWFEIVQALTNSYFPWRVKMFRVIGSRPCDHKNCKPTSRFRLLFFLFLPGFWSGLKSSRLGVRLALKLVSTCLGSYVPGAVKVLNY